MCSKVQQEGIHTLFMLIITTTLSDIMCFLYDVTDECFRCTDSAFIDHMTTHVTNDYPDDHITN